MKRQAGAELSQTQSQLGLRLANVEINYQDENSSLVMDH